MKKYTKEYNLEKLPNLLLLGAQKSASTFLGYWLRQHDGIHVTTREDMTFENPEYESFNKNHLKLNTNARVYGIRRPDYFGNPIYHARLAKHLPKAKIVIVLRNPVERAISAYYHYQKYGLIEAAPPETFKNTQKPRKFRKSRIP